MTVLSMSETRVLNPANVLPVAIGEPVAPLCLLASAVLLRARRLSLSWSEKTLNRRHQGMPGIMFANKPAGKLTGPNFSGMPSV